MPLAQGTDAPPVSVEARCVRFQAKAADPASLAPSVDQHVLSFSQPDQHLVHFAVRLFRQLQAVGSVVAMDMAEYEKAWLNPPD